jgi:hypothetical protein
MASNQKTETLYYRIEYEHEALGERFALAYTQRDVCELVDRIRARGDEVVRIVPVVVKTSDLDLHAMCEQMQKVGA